MEVKGRGKREGGWIGDKEGSGSFSRLRESKTNHGINGVHVTQKRAWGEGSGRVGLISRSLLGAMVTEGMAYLLYFTRLLQGGQFL